MASSSTTALPTEALFGLLSRLADNKYFLGRHYAEWCSGAPTLESAVAAAAMAQDELGHARALYPLLKTLSPKAGAEIEPETRTHFANLAFVETPFSGWEDFVAANFLIDGALTTIFDAAQASTYEPLAGRSRKVLQEERMHALHGEAWVRRLASEGGAVRAACEAALRRAWDETLCWFGPDGADDPLAAAGVLNATPDVLRERFLATIGPTIETAGLDLPLRRDTDTADTATWVLTEPLPWDHWNAETYRISPASVSAAVTANAADTHHQK